MGVKNRQKPKTPEEMTTRKRCVNPILGNCDTPHWLGKPTEDRKALQQTAHPREDSCKSWNVEPTPLPAPSDGPCCVNCNTKTSHMKGNFAICLSCQHLPAPITSAETKLDMWEVALGFGYQCAKDGKTMEQTVEHFRNTVKKNYRL